MVNAKIRVQPWTGKLYEGVFGLLQSWNAASLSFSLSHFTFYISTHCILTLSRVAPSAVSKGGGADWAPPWFLRVLGGCGFKFWWQPHILLRLTPDKRIYNFRIPRTTPTHGLKKWLFEGVCEVRKGPPLWKWSKIDQLLIFLAKWWIFLGPKVLHPLPYSKLGIFKPFTP